MKITMTNKSGTNGKKMTMKQLSESFKGPRNRFPDWRNRFLAIVSWALKSQDRIHCHFLLPTQISLKNTVGANFIASLNCSTKDKRKVEEKLHMLSLNWVRWHLSWPIYWSVWPALRAFIWSKDLRHDIMTERSGPCPVLLELAWLNKKTLMA